MGQRQVWIVETGEYSQRGIAGVYSTPEKAEQGIKDVYSEPYKVAWEPIKDTSWTYPIDGRTERVEQFTLVGHFEAVPGYSAKHRNEFDITAHELDPVAAARPASRPEGE